MLAQTCWRLIPDMLMDSWIGHMQQVARHNVGMKAGYKCLRCYYDKLLVSMKMQQRAFLFKCLLSAKKQH